MSEHGWSLEDIAAFVAGGLDSAEAERLDRHAAECPKCNAALHCCKQCSHFEPSTRFQCLKPIPVRIPLKDKANECRLFEPRVTVARDASPNSAPPQTNGAVPRSPSDARSAFDALFKNKPLP